ncbi:HAD family hydrolase [Micromonospora globispora]|uniref:HAD-IIA family hydrolase n=1 Tax=Micromonospora globispora TaxID=1450148 RepID=UPI000D6F2907|nr:HAD hydrolase-like protein [Micromonospora globispora]PWU55444.1 HAD family hydrolase [Micromonospora globispora]RQW91843.1 HAD family hydrolase [Micromonospora globispora]
MLSGVTAWVLDVDGCLMRTASPGGAGGAAMPGAAELVRDLKAAGHELIVCTNASQRPPARYAAHLRANGIDVADEEFVTAGSAAADYVAVHHPGARVLVVGADGVADPLCRHGVSLADPADADLADVVVVGVADNYPAPLLNAAGLAVDAGAPLYTTVDVPWFHGGLGKSVAVSAMIANAIGWATGVVPQVLGKPSPGLAETLSRRLGAQAVVAVVGDALVEVQLARHMGARAVLVLSGATTAADLSVLPGGQHPDLVLDDVAALHASLPPSVASLRGVTQ